MRFGVFRNVLLTTIFNKTIAKHVIRVHMNRQDDGAEIQGEIDIDKMKKYIAYCKRSVSRRREIMPSDKYPQVNALLDSHQRLWRCSAVILLL